MIIKIKGLHAVLNDGESDNVKVLKIFDRDNQVEHKYYGDIDEDVIKEIESFYDENGRFPENNTELNEYMESRA